MLFSLLALPHPHPSRQHTTLCPALQCSLVCAHTRGRDQSPTHPHTGCTTHKCTADSHCEVKVDASSKKMNTVTKIFYLLDHSTQMHREKEMSNNEYSTWPRSPRVRDNSCLHTVCPDQNAKNFENWGDSITTLNSGTTTTCSYKFSTRESLQSLPHVALEQAPSRL